MASQLDVNENDIFKMALEGDFLPAVAAIGQKAVTVDEIAEVDNCFTLLHAAAYHGDAFAVAALLKLGADPDQTDSRGQTPLHLALRSKKTT